MARRHRGLMLVCGTACQVLPRPLRRACAHARLYTVDAEKETYYHIGGDREVHFVHRDASGGQTPLHPPLLFIHGAACDRRLWPDALRCSPRSHTVALDLLGHGKSPGTGRSSIAEYAEDLASVTEIFLASTPQVHAGAVLVGHSMGGAIATCVAAGWPHLVDGLVLINTAHKLRVASALREQIERDDFDLASVAALMTAMAFPEGTAAGVRDQLGAMLSQTGAGTAQADFLACQRYEPPEALPLRIPSLVVSSDSDKLFSSKASRMLAEKVSTSCTHTVVRSSGHMTPLDQPEALRQVLYGWLRKQRW